MNQRYAGEIRLDFTERNGRTVASTAYRRGNSRISANIAEAGEIPYYFLISTGGGFTEGEHYLQEISLGDRTHAILTTQTPNYIYKCEGGRLTVQDHLVTIGENCALEYYIDETIPYAQARFRQNTEIRMEKGSRLILTDGITSGWSPDGESFQYRDVGLKTRIYMEGELLFNDFLLVNPEEEEMRTIGCFEEASCYHSAVIIDEAAGADMLEKLRSCLQTCPENTDSVRFGMSLLEHGGVVLRVLGRDPEGSYDLVQTWIRYYREQIMKWKHFELRKNR